MKEYGVKGGGGGEERKLAEVLTEMDKAYYTYITCYSFLVDIINN